MKVETLPKISVITPSYNQVQFIERTIKSVITQCYPNVEYIVIDGGSNDGSLEVIKKYDEKISFWCSETDNGQYSAIKKGFSAATGDILCWINSDDMLLPGALTKVASAFLESDADVVFGDIVYADQDGVEIKVMRNTPLIKIGYLYHAGYGLSQPEVFWSREIYERVGGIDDRGQFSMDEDLFLRFIKAGARFKHIRYKLSVLRFHPASKTSTISHVGQLESSSLRQDLFLGNSHVFQKVIKVYVWILKTIYFIRRFEFRYLFGLVLYKIGVKTKDVAK